MKLTMRFVAECEEQNVVIRSNLNRVVSCTNFWIESPVPIVASGMPCYITKMGMPIERLIATSRAIYQDDFEKLIYGSRLLLPCALFRPELKLEHAKT